MNEDSKELARGGSSGMMWDVRFREGIEASALKEELIAWIEHIAASLARNGRMMGHLKAVFRCDQGWVSLNLVDPRLGTDCRLSLVGPVISGRIKVMAALLGMDDRSIREGIVEGTERFARERSGVVELQQLMKDDRILFVEGTE